MDYRILVVEDEPDINNLLARILREEDYKVSQAFSGTEAKMATEREISYSGDRNLRKRAAGG